MIIPPQNMLSITFTNISNMIPQCSKVVVQTNLPNHVKVQFIKFIIGFRKYMSYPGPVRKVSLNYKF